MFRPEPAHWFEALVAHDDCATALAGLAASGAIEIETRAAPSMLAPLTDLKPLLDRYADLARRFLPYWPAARVNQASMALSPRETLLRALGRLSMWHASAEPLVRTLQTLEHEARELDAWRGLLERFRERTLDFGALAGDGLLVRRFYLFPGEAVPPLPHPALAVGFTLGTEFGLLLVATPAALETFHRQATGFKGRVLEIPRWLHGRAQANLPVLERRLHRVLHSRDRMRRVLQRLGAAYDLAPTLGEIERLRWFSVHVDKLPASDHFAWIQGWTSAPPAALREVLAASGARALVRYTAPPDGVVPPLLLRNPGWARPFELFTRALGVPGGDEIDPSRVLAVLVPLLFGYMFGDLGQGLVLLVAGLLLARRYPAARLLVAGGAAAMIFGVLFGSVFAREDWIAPLWLHPLADPLIVLGAPVVFGAAVLALGLVLNGVQAYWRGDSRRWWAGEAGLLVAYAAALPAVFHSHGWWLVAVGLGWYVLGYALHARRVAALAEAAAHLLEQVFQLAVNTLSFTRVGAFALAHAGLSSAIVVLAHSVAHPVAAFGVMLAGNVVIIALEALVVSIQTTRLVLFEFFIRFLRATGRPFRPLPPPIPNLTRSMA